MGYQMNVDCEIGDSVDTWYRDHEGGCSDWHSNQEHGIKVVVNVGKGVTGGKNDNDWHRV